MLPNPDASRVLQPITLPELGVTDRSIRVSTWLTQIGEPLVAGDPVVEVLTRGITFDVEAPGHGRLRRIERFQDDLISAGDVLGWWEPNEDNHCE